MEENDPQDGKKSSDHNDSPLDDDEIFDFFVHDNKREQPKKKRKRGLPKWLDHFNAKDLKVLFKCSMAVWILTVFILIDATLRAIGQAAFFGCIVMFFLPPSGVVLVQILGGLTVIIGLCLGWAWGVITMKAALATRPAADLNAQYAALQASSTQNTTNVDQASGQAQFAQIAIFEGAMLDTRVSVTYFCMISLFIYLIARLRVKTPKLTLVSIFATIVADIYLVIAPLIPTFQGTIPKTMIIPSGIAVGVGALCNILLFPQSTSQIVLDGMHETFVQMRGFGKALGAHLNNPDLHFGVKKLMALREGLLISYKALDEAAKFLPMDFSYGRWSPDDITSLQEPFRQVFVALGELLQVPMFREQGRMKAQVLATLGGKAGDQESKKRSTKTATHQISRTIELHEHLKHPDVEKMTQETYKTLSESVITLLPAWREASAYIADSLKRSKNVLEYNPSEVAKKLQQAQDLFERTASKALMDLHDHLLDEHGNVLEDETGHHPPLLGLMTGLLYVERIGNCCSATSALLEKVTKINYTHQKSRLWLPNGLMNLFSWAVSSEDDANAVQGLQRTTTIASRKAPSRKQARREKKQKKGERDENCAAARLEEMRRPAGRQRHKSSAVFLAGIDWFVNDEGLHALRMLVVTIALGIPAVLKTSAGFYYREKGLWALIMAQLSLMPYSSEFIAGLLTRVAGTILGGVIGLVCWYIGSGSGPGNAFGIAAIMAVVIVAAMWWRLFAPLEQMQASIMTAATVYLVVAYSWIDTHIPSYGNPGVGYNVFWRRLLLVLIGFAASTIVTFFPRPPSGNRHYRHVLKDQLSTIKDRYALLLSTWRSPPGDLKAVVEKEALSSEELLSAIAGPIKLTRLEFSSSNIDTKTLEYACYFCGVLDLSITQLILYSQRLSDEQRARFMYETGAGDESFVADLMAVLTLLQQSLESGTPLPAVLPTPLIARILLRHPVSRRDRSKEVVVQELASQTGRHWISAMTAFLRLVGSVDDLVLVLKRAVGEQNRVDLGVFAQREQEKLQSVV